MNKHEPNCPMLQGQGAACTCGIASDPYPPMSDAEIDRLDAYYAKEPSGLNVTERRLLANIRVLKKELSEIRASRARLMDPVVDPRNSDEPRGESYQQYKVLHDAALRQLGVSDEPTESFEAWVKKHNTARPQEASE